MSAPVINVSAISHTRLFYAVLPAFERSVGRMYGGTDWFLGLLIHFWLSPEHERTLWTSQKHIIKFVHDVSVQADIQPYEKACLERIIKIGILEFCPLKETWENVERKPLKLM